MITLRHLIDMNMRALANKTLGAFLFRMVRYDYGDGCHRCAIGSALDDVQMAQIVGCGLNVAPLLKLLNEGIVAVEDEALFTVTQELHDRWAMQTKYRKPAAPHPNLEVEAFLVECNGKVLDSDTFRAWIALLDRLYPAALPQEETPELETA